MFKLVSANRKFTGPFHILCAYTHKIMRNPVRDPEGHYFEQDAIVACLRHAQKCPIDGRPLRIEALREDRLLSADIEGWRDYLEPIQQTQLESDWAADRFAELMAQGDFFKLYPVIAHHSFSIPKLEFHHGKMPLAEASALLSAIAENEKIDVVTLSIHGYGLELSEYHFLSKVAHRLLQFKRLSVISISNSTLHASDIEALTPLFSTLNSIKCLSLTQCGHTGYAVKFLSCPSSAPLAATTKISAIRPHSAMSYRRPVTASLQPPSTPKPEFTKSWIPDFFVPEIKALTQLLQLPHIHLNALDISGNQLCDRRLAYPELNAALRELDAAFRGKLKFCRFKM